jgi:hypothetical protein
MLGEGEGDAVNDDVIDAVLVGDREKLNDGVIELLRE